MKCIVNTDLNERIGKPSVNAPTYSYYKCGDEVNIIEIVKGDPYDGNDFWYKLDNGRYIWSGGVKDSSNQNWFKLLAEDLKLEIIADFIEKNGEQLIIDYPQITGFGIGNRIKNQQQLNEVCLIIQVPRKIKMPTIKIPTFYKWKQFYIPVDIQEYSDTTSTSPDLSSSVSRIESDEFGTLGIPVVKDSKDYILGCYHVFFNLELAEGERKIENSRETLLCPKFKTGSNNNQLGILVEGELNNWLDYAICQPKNITNVQFKNAVADSLRKAPRLVKKNEGRFLNFFGARSKRAVSGRLLSIFSSQNIKYFINGKKERVLIHGLVQMETPALGGDSGSVVVDSLDRVIGIVIAADNKSTYILTAENIEKRTNYKLKYTTS